MRDDRPVVSIVVLSYNQQDYISSCLDSVISQDYPNMEIVIADDGSTDNTKAICLKYKENYPFIKLSLSEINCGITVNCNKGLALCTGELLCLTGGDDLFLPGKISAQAEWFRQHPDGAICTGDIEVFDSETNKTILISRNKGFMKGGPIKRIIRMRNHPPSSNFMLNWKLCGDIRFDERTPVVSDWLFFTEACMRGRIGYIQKVYLKYRRHSQNITGAGAEKSHLDDRLIYTDLLLSKYPRYSRSCKIQRANIFYEVAKREFFQHNYKVARQRSYSGIHEFAFDWRNWIMIVATFFGDRIRNVAIKMKK